MIIVALSFAAAIFGAREVKTYSVEFHRGFIANGQPAQTPGVDDWPKAKPECPFLFRREVDEFGIFRVGPKCADEDFIAPHTSF